jgi:hypothetical protein
MQLQPDSSGFQVLELKRERKPDKSGSNALSEPTQP